MIRVPLRPLAHVLAAKARGDDPDTIQVVNTQARRDSLRQAQRQRAEGRVLMLGLCFLCAFLAVGVRMATLALSDPVEPRARVPGAQISALRADIVDRSGRTLATNLETHALYAQPHRMIEPQKAARALSRIFPDMDEDSLAKRFAGPAKFIWLKRRISPEQMQAVHEIGEPGLQFGQREMRLYPNGTLGAHVLGGVSFGREGVASAELVGVAGVERYFDERLRDPAQAGTPLALSIDLTVQAAAERVLAGGMKLVNARGAAAVLMDVRTGEVVSMVSLPDFDPNDRPAPAVSGDPADSPLFNRAVQGVYELGSTFKALTTAQALDMGLVTPETAIDVSAPVKWGKYSIRDGIKKGKSLTVSDILTFSSNIGTARIAQKIGIESHRQNLGSLGFFAPTPLEVAEARTGRPILPKRWSELSTMTISFGHGLSSSLVHLATGYAAIANGGLRVTPTLLRQDGETARGLRIYSEKAARQTREILRRVVTEGTASFARPVPYLVAGKTGTADKPKPTGGYYEDRVIATFAAIFPADDPAYVLVVALDEPVETTGLEPRRAASWTAVPVASAMISRIAPLLGLRPAVAPAPLGDITVASSN